MPLEKGCRLQSWMPSVLENALHVRTCMFFFACACFHSCLCACMFELMFMSMHAAAVLVYSAYSVASLYSI